MEKRIKGRKSVHLLSVHIFGSVWRRAKMEILEFHAGLTLKRSRSRNYFTFLCLGIEHPYGTCDHILLPVGLLLSEICGRVSVGRPL
jgi:hypothetical protein